MTAPPPPLLIRNASLLSGRRVDLRLAGGRISALAQVGSDEGGTTIDAGGGLLIPGLHDHHIHLAATAAAWRSVRCGPPEVTDSPSLIRALTGASSDWLRGIGYHESVAGLLERSWLDRVAGHRPVRIQHRGGRMWFLNSAAVDLLLASGRTPPAGLDRESGRLFDGDAWLRDVLASAPLSLASVGTALARYGITGVTEMGPNNASDDHAMLSRQQDEGMLPQRVVLAGREELANQPYSDRLLLGPVKLHLHDADLPPLDALVRRIAGAHGQDRGVAIHCVTLAELVLALAALREAGVHSADRIEHASVATDAQVEEMASLQLAVSAQPLFVFERGDAYRRDIPESEWPLLYRLRALTDAGIPLAGSSDAPYVAPDPWAAIDSAMTRRTREGHPLGPAEALTAERALALYLADPLDVRTCRMVSVGAPADLCLLDRNWQDARIRPSASYVRMTLIGGTIVHDRDAPVPPS